MGDPHEGVSPDGTIRTGAGRDLVPDVFEPILSDAVALLADDEASLYVYGSVATGQARPGSSDVDLLAIDLRGAATIRGRLSAAYADRCRGVELSDGVASTSELAVRVARKTLLATAGLVSVRDHTWTTDRARACQRWSEIEPRLAAPLALLQSWSDGQPVPSRGELEGALDLDGVVATVVARFADTIGLWPEDG